MRTVTIPQWGSIFSGKPALEGSTKHYRAKPDDMDRWLTLLSMSTTAPAILEATESAVEFSRLRKISLCSSLK